MKMQCQVCCPNFVGEKEKKKKNLMDMLFYLAQSSSLLILQKIYYHKKNAQFLPQLTHMADYDWWKKK